MKPFVMKQFQLRHRLSAMKVGVDAVLLGAWAKLPPRAEVLDSGCGCGIISLMLAQRYPQALITAIDVDPLAVIEARENFSASPWGARLHGCRRDFLAIDRKFDAIVSNPPYFDAGIRAATTRRELARHAAGLSPLTLLSHGAELLNPGGSVSMIVPTEWLPALTDEAEACGLYLSRKCLVQGNLDSPVTRALLTFSLTPSAETETENIIIEYERGEYTPAYRELTKDFYLKF